MGSDSGTRWGPPTLADVARRQLAQHGFATADASAVAAELADALGPAAKASLFVDLGACSFLSGDVAAAIASWRQAVVSGQVAPASRALYNLGLLHEHLGLHDEAVERFDAAIEHGIEPHATHAVLAKARSLADGGRPEKAMTTLARLAEDLIEDDPDSPVLGEALFGLGTVAEAAGQLDRAEQAYRTAMNSADDRVRDDAAVALVRVLRFVGHEDEAQQFVETTGLALHDPSVVLDRIELLTRLGRVDDALAVLDDVPIDDLSVADQFRLATLQIDVDRVNDAIDVLEGLTEHGAAETQARAAYQLGDVYLSHDMVDAARSMFGTVRRLQSGYWADKSALILGDLAMQDGKYRSAAAHWADAAASRVETVADAARERLVEAVAPPVDAPEADSTSADATSVDAVVSSPVEPVVPGLGVLDEPDGGDDGPATEAIDMLGYLDTPDDVVAEPPAAVPLGEPAPAAAPAPPAEPAPIVQPAASTEPTSPPAPLSAPAAAAPPMSAPPVSAPAEPAVHAIVDTAPAATAMGPVQIVIGDSLPAPEVDSTEPIAAPAGAPAAPTSVATSPVDEPPAKPSAPTVVPLRRRSTASTETTTPPEATRQPEPDSQPEAPLDVPFAGAPAPDGAADRTPKPDPIDVVIDDEAAAVAADMSTVEAVADEPSIVPIVRRSASAREPVDVLETATDSGPNEVADEAVIDLRERSSSNPYAALAPEALDDDPVPSDRNPYAELAPNFEAEPVETSLFRRRPKRKDDDSGGSAFSRFA